MSKDESLIEFAALNEEARRRGTSYGRLVASLTRGQEREIIERYRKAKTKGNRKKSAAP